VTRGGVLIAVVLLVMLVEWRLSQRHERALRHAGAIEPSGDVYAWMRILYPLCFVAMGVEGLRARDAGAAWFVSGATVFAAAKALKFWAMASLGSRWSFRVLVVPGGRLVTSGPYRWLRHPNYVAIVGELAGVAVALRAPAAGALSIVVFGVLLARRTAVEERALGLR
jgi:methyltransferase